MSQISKGQHTIARNENELVKTFDSRDSCFMDTKTGNTLHNYSYSARCIQNLMKEQWTKKASEHKHLKAKSCLKLQL